MKTDLRNLKKGREVDDLRVGDGLFDRSHWGSLRFFQKFVNRHQIGLHYANSEKCQGLAQNQKIPKFEDIQLA